LTVSALATRCSTNGSASANLTITAGVNDTVNVTVDNVATAITLTPGTYASPDALAAEVQARINGAAALSAVGSSVAVTANNGVLSITSQRYGTASTAVIGDGDGAVGLFGSSPAAPPGPDVPGPRAGGGFVGAGQTATGATTTSAEGLQLTIAGGVTGNRGSVSFNRGVAAQLNDSLTQFLDPSTGIITTATDSLNASIKDVQSQEDDWNTRLVSIRARITAQYNAMDSLVASLNSTSSYLTQQLAALAKSTGTS